MVNKTKTKAIRYQQGNMCLRRKELVSSGRSDFFTLLFSACKKHCSSRASILSVDVVKVSNATCRGREKWTSTFDDYILYKGDHAVSK